MSADQGGSFREWTIPTIGQVVEVPTANGGTVLLRRIEGRYSYAENKCTCPCGDLGMPWGGWFNCESGHSALVESGEMFERAKGIPNKVDDYGKPVRAAANV